MENKEKYLRTNKRLKIGIIVFSILSVVMLVGNKSYALFNNTVKTNNSVVSINTSSEFPKKGKIGIDEVKDTMGKEGGVVGVTTSNSKTIDKDANYIREYRYSGLNVNNYIYFNCKDDVKEQNSDNCEVWRILGIFKDENEKEHLKIVRNEVLSEDMLPTTYQLSSLRTFKIKLRDNEVYWNWDGSNATNGWSDAGIQYWLNDEVNLNGYLHSLSVSSRKLITPFVYHFGNVSNSSEGMLDTTAAAYKNEQSTTVCTNTKSCAGGTVSSGNSATFTSKIALMYVSDYGFTSESNYWSSVTFFNFSNAASQTSWLNFANHTSEEWLLSPVGDDNYNLYSTRKNVTVWREDGSIYHRGVSGINAVRPCLYLDSDAEIIYGDGTDINPYQLSYKSTMAHTIKTNLGNNDIVGVPVTCDTDNCDAITDVNADETTIREYRYSGANVKNYIWFNCQDDVTYEDASTKCEKWRIIGLFKDDNNEEHLKIVRNETISADVVPFRLVYSSSITYKIKLSETSPSMYFDDKLDANLENYNDWSKSGLMHALNYYNSMNLLFTSNAKNLLKEIVYYLGNVTYYSTDGTDGDSTHYGIKDNALEAYKNERSSNRCSSTNKNTCQGGYIWPNNAISWTGKVGLMYPSDIGFSSKSTYWKTSMGSGTFDVEGAANNSWLCMDANHNYSEWLISPSSYVNDSVAQWNTNNTLGMYYSDYTNYVRPTVNLYPTIIMDGDGTSESPYLLK